MSTDEPTGVDLARVALAAAKKAAKERGTTTSANRAPKRRTVARRNGRDPLGLGGALAQLVTERGWETPAAGGSVMDRWSAIVSPEIAANLRPAAFDQSSGRLDLVPATGAWATQARLISAQLTRQANTAVGTEAVRQIRVMPVGARTSIAGPAPAPEPAAPAPAPRGEIRTRENASAGYHRARAALTPAPADVPQGPVRTRDDGCDGYQQVRAALRKSPPAGRAEQAPVRTQEDGCDGYQQARSQVGAPVPRQPNEAPVNTRKSASTGYQLTRRALLDGRSRSRGVPA
ncbi:DciA family protein [Streptomyces sp. NPDC048638]|uniref:DciA family protein n=1 Tax=Streptomyces sp. NPDC048638 TaxID=3365580 RepID=UPI003717217B